MLLGIVVSHALLMANLCIQSSYSSHFFRALGWGVGLMLIGAYQHQVIQLQYSRIYLSNSSHFDSLKPDESVRKKI